METLAPMYLSLGRPLYILLTDVDLSSLAPSILSLLRSIITSAQFHFTAVGSKPANPNPLLHVAIRHTLLHASDSNNHETRKARSKYFFGRRELRNDVLSLILLGSFVSGGFRGYGIAMSFCIYL